MKPIIIIFLLLNLGCYAQKEINEVDEFGMKQGKWIEIEQVPKEASIVNISGVDSAGLPLHESSINATEYEDKLRYKSLGNYKDNFKMGIWETFIGYEENWRLVKKTWYKERGIVIRHEQYYENGKIKLLREKQDSISVLIRYDVNGKVLQKIKLSNE